MSNSENNTSDNRPVREQILGEAASLITGQRQEDYGPPEENLQRIGDLWTIHLKKILKHDASISPRIVAEMMVLLKLARTQASPTKDSYVDAAGYAGIAGELATKEEEIKRMTQILLKTTDETTENKPNELNHNCGPWCK